MPGQWSSFRITHAPLTGIRSGCLCVCVRVCVGVSVWSVVEVNLCLNLGRYGCVSYLYFQFPFYPIFYVLTSDLHNCTQWVLPEEIVRVHG